MMKSKNFLCLDKKGFWMASEVLTINKHSRLFIKKALEQFNELEATLLRLKCEAWERLKDAEIERQRNLPVSAPEPEVAEAKFIPADPWDSAEKDCQEAFQAYLEAGGLLRTGDDYMKGINHSIGMLLSLSFKLQSDLWTHRKVRLETKKLIGCN